MKRTPFYAWGEVALQFINSKNVKRRESEKSFRARGYGFKHVEIQCQSCGGWFDQDKINVHHARPVSLLGENELGLIWDYSNLRALCKDCHAGSHGSIHEARQQAKVEDVKKEWQVLF